MLDPNSSAFHRSNMVLTTGQMTGDHRPVGRVTVGRNFLRGHLSKTAKGIWRNILFSQGHYGVEREFLGVVKSINISRSVDDDAASCTITLYNDGSHLSTKPQNRKGYWTPSRSDKPAIQRASRLSAYDPTTAYPTDWKQTNPEAYNWSGDQMDPLQYSEGWLKSLFVPNRIVRTYQGYGSSNWNEWREQRLPEDPQYVTPKDDDALFQTGVWLINRVQLGQDGLIVLECSDLAKLLLKQIVYPPMIPLDRFPLVYCPISETPEETRGEKGGVGANVAKGYHSSSNDVRMAKNSALYGHRPSHAFDGRQDSYWLSTGNVGPTKVFSFEWIQTPCGGNEVNEVVASLKGANYTVFVSVMENGKWQGGNVVPYDPNHRASYPNGANIPYVVRTTVGDRGDVVIKLPRAYKAQHVRICLTNLWNSRLGQYPYRGAVRELKCRWNRPDTYEHIPATSNRGESGVIATWTDAVKELLGWAGFTWYASPVLWPNLPHDPVLGRDKITDAPFRIWGDVEILPGPKVCTKPEEFLNKSFMECINLIGEWMGCIFFVDESGGAIFRLPNFYKGGNFIHDPYAPSGSPFHEKSWPIEVHDNANLIDYSLIFDDEQLRSEVLVVGGSPSLTGDVGLNGPPLGGVLLQRGGGGNDIGNWGIPGVGSDSLPTTNIDLGSILNGQYRLMVLPGEKTKGFSTIEECQRAAEMTALFILFTYRRGEISAPAHPALQLDDQIRVFNQVTNETNIQYVSAISTSMDLDEGVYGMNITVNWLGGDPDTDWFLSTAQITPAMRTHPGVIARIGSTKGSGSAGNIAPEAPPPAPPT